MDRRTKTYLARESLYQSGCSIAHSIHELYRTHKTWGGGLTEKQRRYAARLERDAKDLLERHNKLREAIENTSLK